jgi:DNA repair exonuclease SbcCD nuclease subunit
MLEKEVKFVFMTDIHGRTNNPISRKDDFPETILNKLRWVVDYANRNDAGILCGGDWLNRPDTSATFISKMCGILEMAQQPVVGILGNHDLFGYNAKSFTRTPLAIAAACNNMHILGEEEVDVGSDTFHIYLSGSHSSPLIDRAGRTEEYYTPRRNKPKSVDEVRIHIVHGFLTDKDWPDGVPYTKIDAVKDTDADILLAGHEHLGFGIKTDGDTIFCNPGALGRVSAGIGEINRDVKIAEITVWKELNMPIQYSIKLVPLPEEIARPASEVLDREKIELEKEMRKKIDGFAEQIRENSANSVLKTLASPDEAIDVILSQDKFGDVEINDDIRSTVLEYIGRAKEVESENKKKLKAE